MATGATKIAVQGGTNFTCLWNGQNILARDKNNIRINGQSYIPDVQGAFAHDNYIVFWGFMPNGDVAVEAFQGSSPYAAVAGFACQR